MQILCPCVISCTEKKSKGSNEIFGSIQRQRHVYEALGEAPLLNDSKETKNFVETISVLP